MVDWQALYDSTIEFEEQVTRELGTIRAESIRMREMGRGTGPAHCIQRSIRDIRKVIKPYLEETHA